jgi:DedD protein
MDQGLKERLIGAAVLIALGVWLIPWVLNGPDEQTVAKSSALQLPATEEPLPIRSQTLDLSDDGGAPEAASAAQSPAAAPLAEAEADVAPAAAIAPTSAPVVAPKPAAVPEPPAAEPPATVTAAAPPKKPAPASTTKPAPSPAAKPATAAAKGEWIVQLGSFGEEANARRLADRVRTFGYKPEVSSIRSGGRSMYRVRVGPASGRNEADATASALGAHGLTARVVAAE